MKLMKPLTFIAAVITLVLMAVAAAVPACAWVDASAGPCDSFVYAPGVYDFTVKCSEPGAEYQWLATVSGSGFSEVIELSDGPRFSGTSTSHLSLICDDSMTPAAGNWNSILFSCRVSAGGESRTVECGRMTVETCADLLRSVGELGIGITDFSLGQGEFLGRREIAGTVYFDCAAGTVLHPAAAFTGLPADKPEYAASEVTLEAEIIITEGGKSTVCQPSAGYTLQGSGAGAAVVRADLFLCVNGVRREKLDSKSAVINSIIPAQPGDPQNPSVALYGLSEPAAGLPVSAAVELESNALCDLASVDPVLWFDNTESRLLTASDVFFDGHTYSVEIRLEAKSGAAFPVSGSGPSISATLNGLAASVEPVEGAQPDRIIAVKMTFDHVHNTAEVPKTDPGCTFDGKQSYYHCVCGADFEEAECRTPITDAGWGLIPALGHSESAWQTDAVSHFRVCTRPGCGEIIEGSSGSHTGGEATCLCGPVCTVCLCEWGEKAGHLWSLSDDCSGADGHAHSCLYLCGEHTEIEPHREGPLPTAVDPQVCPDCGYVLLAAGTHVHAIALIPAREPGCEQPGNAEYYRCSTCGKAFADPEGKKQISAGGLSVPATGHTASAEWKSDGDRHMHFCLICGSLLFDTGEAHSFAAGSDRCDVCGYVPPPETTAVQTSPADPPVSSELTEPDPFNNGVEDTSEDDYGPDTEDDYEDPIDDPDDDYEDPDADYDDKEDDKDDGPQATAAKTERPSGDSTTRQNPPESGSGTGEDDGGDSHGKIMPVIIITGVALVAAAVVWFMKKD